MQAHYHECECGLQTILTMESDNLGDDDKKDEHKRLAGVVKGVHAGLRRKFKRNKDADFAKLWVEHCENETLLRQYAEAMHHLAVDHWAKRQDTRIDWCRAVMLEYFFHGGLKKVMEKEVRRAIHHQHNMQALHRQRVIPGCCLQEQATEQTFNEPEHNIQLHPDEHKPFIHASEQANIEQRISYQYEHQNKDECRKMEQHDLDLYLTDDVNHNHLEFVPVNPSHDESASEADVLVPLKLHENVSQLPGGHIDVTGGSPLSSHSKGAKSKSMPAMAHHVIYKPITYNIVTLPFEGKIRLLDVGSCYNPFLEFDEFLAVGLDISPAKSSVLRCDFLHVEATESLQLASDSLDTYLRNLTSPVEKLPRCIFHVVVFSLLLEYFPSPYQRWMCCEKAHKLLAENGLLLIITPDSHQQHRNSHMIRSWKTAITSMGFERWRYIKQDHLHCMAFRKVVPVPDNGNGHLVSDIGPDLLYIPQDCNDEKDEFVSSYTVQDEQFFRKTVHDLPLADDSDDDQISD